MNNMSVLFYNAAKGTNIFSVLILSFFAPICQYEPLAPLLCLETIENIKLNNIK